MHSEPIHPEPIQLFTTFSIPSPKQSIYYSCIFTVLSCFHTSTRLQFCRKFQTLEDDNESICCRCGMHPLGELRRHYRNSAKHIIWGIPRRYAASWLFHDKWIVCQRNNWLNQQVDDLLFSSNSCAVTNDTDYICEIFLGVENYRNGCNASGGEFYSGLYLRDPALTRCTSNISGTSIKRELTMNYPFCAATSCNGSEIVMAYTAMISADRESGHLNEVWTNGCSYPYIVTSNAYNSHIAVGIIYVTLAMFSIVMLLSL